jgi:hypothetical protein
MGYGVVERAMKQLQKAQSKSAILLLEEAVHLLRQAPIALLSAYYIGSLPFILGLLYFWVDMSRSADAKDYHAVASLGLALLYIWMKCWQAVFAARVKMHFSEQPMPRWSLQRVFVLVVTQTLIHATAFFILPLAAVAAIPFGWCYAFYQNASAQNAMELNDLKSVYKNAWIQAKLWPRQNHLLLSIFFIFGVIVFLNIAVAIYILPHVLKNYFGIESMFTLSGFHVINTTFWVVCFGISYLCMNPLVKTVYALRCFYGAASNTGDDLKTELKRLIPSRARVVTAVLIVALSTNLIAPIAAETRFTSPEELDRSIDEVMQRREFTWRMPRQTSAADEEDPKGPIASVVDWIVEKLGKGLNAVIKWIDKLIEWIIKLMPSDDRRTPSADEDWVATVRVAVIVLLIGLLCALAYILRRTWLRRQAAQAEVVAAAVESAPDLEDEDTTADDLPANRWLKLARELAQKGSLRLAIRAFYLATLANLAEHELITIEKFKSNKEYELELQRRAHEKEGLLSAFSKSREIFERVWYGMYKINRPDLDNYAAVQKRMMTIAES